MEMKFEPGRIVISNEVQGRISFGDAYDRRAFQTFVDHCIARHLRGDWGNVTGKVKAKNNDAVENGGRILSAYNIDDEDEKLLIITEADRSVTTIIFQDEY